MKQYVNKKKVGDRNKPKRSQSIGSSYAQELAHAHLF